MSEKVNLERLLLNRTVSHPTLNIGANDGLVSVESSKWGVYKATLDNVNHLYVSVQEQTFYP